MQNAWNVQYEHEGRTVVRKFEGDSPKASGAVQFRNDLIKNGISAEIYSRRHGFAPPLKQINPPHAGLLWCPYCIKWREFEESIVARGDYETPELLRCTVCLISIKDYWVRKYNPAMVARFEAEAELRSAKAPQKPVLRRRRR